MSFKYVSQNYKDWQIVSLIFREKDIIIFIKCKKYRVLRNKLLLGALAFNKIVKYI